MKPRKQPYGTANHCGATIERLRKEKNMRQGDLAIAAGINVSNMSKIEGQIRVCKDYELRAISRVLGVTMDALFVDQPPKTGA